MESTDQELISQALAGAEEGYRGLVERYQQPVVSLVRRIVHDPAWAEDLAQEAFVKAFRALASFQAGRKFSSWLFKIAHNTAIDALRRRRLDTVPLTGADPDQGALLDVLPDTDEASPSRSLRSRELGVAIAAAIAGLRPEYRSAIELRFLRGLAYEEIADIMELPLGTVKTHLHRARKALMERLAEEGWTPEP